MYKFNSIFNKRKLEVKRSPRHLKNIIIHFFCVFFVKHLADFLTDITNYRDFLRRAKTGPDVQIIMLLINCRPVDPGAETKNVNVHYS